MHLSRFAILLPIAFLFAACVSPSENAGATSTDAPTRSGAGDKESEKSADELRKKEHARDVARLQLEITRLSATADEAAAQSAVETARRELVAARAEFENFQSALRGIEVGERALAVDRAKQRLSEDQEELAEIEAMYAQEKFAELTKELVITRGRNRLELSRRGLAQVEAQFEQLRSFEHPKRERDLSEKVIKAERSLTEAQAKIDKLTLEQRLAARKAEHELAELERELARLRAKAGGGS